MEKLPKNKPEPIHPLTLWMRHEITLEQLFVLNRERLARLEGPSDAFRLRLVHEPDPDEPNRV